MKVAAVIGGDVSRSLSPRLHGAAAQALGLRLEYGALSCADEAAFRREVMRLAGRGAIGANVTIPFKPAALAMSRSLSPVALRIGAVNRITFNLDACGISLYGDNTDGPALVRELAGAPIERVQILGAGGSARAAAWALGELGVRPGALVVSARDPVRAAEVAALAGGQAAGLAPVEGATLVISTLPGDEQLAARALEEWIDAGARPVVFDLAYLARPRHSALTDRAIARGLTAQDGLGMLVEQAALSFVAWLGGDLSAIRAAMWESLGVRFDTKLGRA